MQMKYIRMKLKVLFLVVAGTAAAGAVWAMLVDYLLGGGLNGLCARLFVAVAYGLFGQTREHALELYRTCVSSNEPAIIAVGMLGLMLLAFYLAMGWFGRWLDQIGQATRQVVNDSEEAIRLPRELHPLEEDLKAIQLQLRQREEGWRESERRKSDLISYLAHDLKTPLTSVVGYLTLLNAQPDLEKEERLKYTGIALEKAERLKELLAEFFDITRMELKPDAAELEPIQLSMLLEQLTDEFYPLFSEKGLQCVTDIAHHLTVRGDPDKLARVFDNVLRNAVNYSTEGGLVDIRASETRGNVEITISNEGLEIPEGELGNIFHKFYRLDAARSTRTGGAGLGLAIAKEIVEVHGGTIRAESNGKFTSFVIVLPSCWEEK